MESKTLLVQIAKSETKVQKLENYPFFFFFWEQFDKQMGEEMGKLKENNIGYQLVSVSQQPIIDLFLNEFKVWK